MLADEFPLIEDQCRMLVLMVILRAVEDYQLCVSSGYIRGNSVDTSKIYHNFKTNTGRLGLGLSEPCDIQSLISFFHGEGLENLLEVASLNVDADCVKRALHLPYGSISGAFFGTVEGNFTQCGNYSTTYPDPEINF